MLLSNPLWSVGSCGCFGGELGCACVVLQLHTNICPGISIHGAVIRNLAQVGGMVIKMSGCFICSQEGELSFCRLAWVS